MTNPVRYAAGNAVSHPPGSSSGSCSGGERDGTFAGDVGPPVLDSLIRSNSPFVIGAILVLNRWRYVVVIVIMGAKPQPYDPPSNPGSSAGFHDNSLWHM
jgi:hypothetical protein